MELTEQLFRVVDNGAGVEPAPSVITENNLYIENPSIAVLNKFGYFPKELNESVRPEDQEGYVVIDDGYKLVEEDGVKYIKRCYRKLEIVDTDAPDLADNQELYKDEWVDTDTQRIHRYTVVELVDEPPTLEEGQQIISSDWEYDLENLKKIRRYEVRFIVDQPPELPEGETFVDDYWDDDGVTRTHIYPRSMKVIDNKPVLEEGQQIVDSYFEDDDETNTRTYHYEVRKIVDHEPPELAENQFINSEFWSDDGVTREHIYDVWTRIDQKPEYDEATQRLIDDGEWEENPETKTITHKYVVKNIVDNKPEDDPDGNFYYVEDGEEETDTEIIKKYKKVEKVWRVFSKLSIEACMFEMGLLDRFDAFIDGLEITNKFGQTVKLRRFYDQANDLKENHEFFKPYYHGALTALGLTEEQGECILSKCVVVSDV